MQVCQHDLYEDIDDCSRGGQIGTVATSKCKNHYKPAFGPSSVKRECMSDKRWSITRTLACNLGIDAVNFSKNGWKLVEIKSTNICFGCAAAQNVESQQDQGDL